MKPEIIKKIQDEAQTEESHQIPLYLPVPEYDERQEEVSVISHIIEIDL